MPDGNQPNGPLLQASDGNFYGTTRGGGLEGCRPQSPIPCGVIFKVTPDGSESVLHAFPESGLDGYTPSAALIQGKDGVLYGTASNGGAFEGGGTVFKVSLDGKYTVLHSFGATANDGVVPTGIIEGADGNLYGITASGGANHCAIPQDGGNCGTVYKLAPDGTETVLHSFGASPTDGVQPGGSLVQASDGNLYGTTSMGGDFGRGTIFRITTAGALTVMHSFGSSSTDGLAAQGPLIVGADGALYGTTASGGEGSRCSNSYGCGTVFRISLTGAFSLVYSFGKENRLNGDGPTPFLIQARDGNFYGTTYSGGAYQCDSCGTAFRLTPSGVLTTLYSFGPVTQNPNEPGSGVTQGRDGAFYGVTFSGGIGSAAGTVFKMTVQ